MSVAWRRPPWFQSAGECILRKPPHPPSSQKFAEATTLFVSSNLKEQALRTARKGVEFNKNYFNAWLLLWYLPDATAQEKAEALKNLKRLDPLNPDPTAQ